MPAPVEHQSLRHPRVHHAPRLGGPVVMIWPSGSAMVNSRFAPHEISQLSLWIFWWCISHNGSKFAKSVLPPWRHQIT